VRVEPQAAAAIDWTARALERQRCGDAAGERRTMRASGGSASLLR
jgi:hypothetical protein